jgi:hypothetical protein
MFNTGHTGSSMPDGLNKIVSFALPDVVTSIDNYAFRDCTNLALISLPEGLTSIRSLAFFECTNLAQIELPAGITSIDPAAFNGCSNLALVTCLATTPPTLGRGVFGYTHSTLRIEVPAGSVDAYKAAENWSAYADRIFAIE